MRTVMILAIVTLAAAPAAAQGRRNNANIPPGQMPRTGECRVWYDGVPPGRQPAPTNCDNAERIASRDRNARVIYGDDRYSSGTWDRNDQWGRDGSRPSSGRPAQGRAVPRDGYPDTYGYPDSRYPSQGGRYGSIPYQNGYQDGIAKAQEDTRDNDAFDPARHGWYKSANRGYNSRYGTREQYASEYRDGFLEAYRQNYRGRNTRDWWPF